MNLPTALARLLLLHTGGPRALDSHLQALTSFFLKVRIVWLAHVRQTQGVARRKPFAWVWVALAYETGVFTHAHKGPTSR